MKKIIGVIAAALLAAFFASGALASAPSFAVIMNVGDAGERVASRGAVNPEIESKTAAAWKPGGAVEGATKIPGAPETSVFVLH